MLFSIDLSTKELRRKKNDSLLDFRPKDNTNSKRKSSSAWDSFHLIYETTNPNSALDGFVYCIKCNEFVPYNGPTTSQLLRHKCILNQPTIRNQPTIIDSFGPKIRINFSESDTSNMRDAAMQFVVRDIRPFYAVEGDGLRNFCKTMLMIGQKYSLMSDDDIERLIPHRTVITEHVHKKAEEVKRMIMEDFHRALKFPGSFSCTTDLWTVDYRHISYLCLTAHINIFEDGQIRYKKYVYHVDSMDAISKTADVVFKEIRAVLENYGVSEEYMKNRIYWTTDRGGNIRSALSGCKRLNCYAHMLNNIVENVCKDEETRKTIKRAAALVKFMKSSGLNSKLKKSLKSYTETRWNTVHDCISSIEENYSDVLKLLVDKEQASHKNVEYVQRLTCISKQQLHDIAQFLSTFKYLTNEIEGDKYVTIYRLWPAFIRINKLMELSVSDSTTIRKMKILGRSYILSIRDDFSPTLEHKIGVFLHPMLKGLNMATILEKEEIYSNVRSLFAEGEAESNNVDQAVPQSAPREHEIDIRNSLFDGFFTENEQPCDAIIDDELQRYIDFRLQNVIRIVFYSHIFNSEYF